MGEYLLANALAFLAIGSGRMSLSSEERDLLWVPKSVTGRLLSLWLEEPLRL